MLCPAHVATTIADDERNAPPGHIPRRRADPSLQADRERVNRDLAAGTPPAQAAQVFLDGIREHRLHLFPHPEWTKYIQARTDMIMRGENPPPGKPSDLPVPADA